MTASSQADPNAVRQGFQLTRAAIGLVQSVLDGRMNQETAAEFEIAEQTVKDHESNIHRKVGVASRVSLVRLLLYCCRR